MRTLCSFTAVLLPRLALAGCDDAVTEAQTAQQPPPPVTVAAPLQKNISEWDEFTGRFEAAKEVEIRSRVSGFLDRNRSFATVRSSERALFSSSSIPRPFRIALEQAKAQVEQARSPARTDRKRGQARRAAGQSQHDSRRANWSRARRVSARRRPCSSRPRPGSAMRS